MRKNNKKLEISKAFGKKVREKRLEMHLSQEEFAELADLHRTYISDIELGKVDVGLSVVFKILHALKTTPDKFFKETYR